MQPIQVYPTATPIELSPPVSYWKAYENRINLWSVLNKTNQNKPELLYPGMRIVIALKGKTYQGIFAGFTDLASKVPHVVILDKMIHQPWMDKEPNLDTAVKTVWSHQIKLLGGEQVPFIFLPITFYPSDTTPNEPGLPEASSGTPMPSVLPPLIEIPGIPPVANNAPTAPPIIEKFVKIGGQTVKLIGDDVFAEDWVNLVPDEMNKLRICDLVVDGKTVDAESFKLQKLDWVKQEQ